jgi:uncharacterized membrane protein
MVLSAATTARWLVALFALSLVVAPAAAHKGEKHGMKPAATVSAGVPGVATPPAAHSPAPAVEAQTERNHAAGFFPRLTDWLGRLHPIVVHFPMAFLPAALFTAVVGRRRPGFAAPVQFLVVAGGIGAALAAVLGWLSAGIPSDGDDWLLTSHRWLGTGIGLVALVLGVWAGRRPERDRSTAMIVGLTVITAAIVTQGWLGGAMVHGLDHLDW